MLTRPLTLNDSDDKGRGLVAVTPPPVLPLAEQDGKDGDDETGVLLFLFLFSIFIFLCFYN